MKICLLFTFSLALFSGAFLFHIKHEVYGLEKKEKVLCAQYVNLMEDIRLLENRWAFLTRPERVEQLVNRYWGQVPMVSGHQMMALPQLIDEGKELRLLSQHP